MNITVFFGSFPYIDLGDIVLREINENDNQAYFSYMNNKIMEKYITSDNIPKDLNKSKEELLYWGNLFKNKQSIYWGIAEKKSNRLIGSAGFNMISFPNSRADISYDLDPGYWGKGIMLKSIKAIINYSETVLKIVRIQAFVICDNQRYIKLLSRCLFNKEGSTLPQP
ncbi:MAG TPA: GNAT family N-acetyltransferase, partial [Candidatus Megaira endosymbiont of Hartmannula sinica]|nr:GNAT family N-acetyltransferase [Candidatus Megaera endosymbiont of Hartmannula sinica]